MPPDPYFSLCDETNTYEVALPTDGPFVNISPALLNMEAFDGANQPIPILILDEVREEPVQFLALPTQNLTIQFQANDEYGRMITCDVHLAIVGEFI